MLAESKKQYWDEYQPKQILEKPANGWGCFSFNDALRISYIDPMPFFVLDSIINNFKNNTEFCVTFDAEGYEYTLLSYDNFSMECILRLDDIKVIELDTTYKEFIYDLLYSIEMYIDDWSIFPCDFEEYTKESLVSKIKEIRNLLKDKLNYY